MNVFFQIIIAAAVLVIGWSMFYSPVPGWIQFGIVAVVVLFRAFPILWWFVLGLFGGMR